MKGKIIKSILIVGVLFFLLFPTMITAETMGGTFSYKLPSSQHSSEQILATAYYRNYNTRTGEVSQEPVQKLTLDEAYLLHNELLAIEGQSESSLEKIKMQIAILKEWAILPEETSFETSLSKIEMIAKNRPVSTQTSLNPNVIICGPAVTSFLTIGGPIFPLHVALFRILPPFWYNSTINNYDLMDGTKLGITVGILPITAFYCTAASLINAYGIVIGENTVISPFVSMSILSVLASVSITFFSNGFPVNVFDWIIGISATGLIAYIDIT